MTHMRHYAMVLVSDIWSSGVKTHEMSVPGETDQSFSSDAPLGPLRGIECEETRVRLRNHLHGLRWHRRSGSARCCYTRTARPGGETQTGRGGRFPEFR